MTDSHDPRSDALELGDSGPPPSPSSSELEPVLEPLAAGDPWLTAGDVQAYLDLPGEPDTRMVDVTDAVIAAVERRRSDLDFEDGALVPHDIRVGAIRWAGLMYQARGAPSGFTGYDEASTLYDALGAQRAEIMRLLGWRRPVAM